MTRSTAGFTAQLHTVTEARARLLAAVSPHRRRDSVSLDVAMGRVLADDVQAAFNVPPNDNSAMDGYVLRYADFEATAGVLPVSARIQAGDAPDPLRPGTAARIFTGAVVPEGGDTVVMQEKTAERDGRVRIDGNIAQGDNIRRAGEDLETGKTIIAAGRRLRPQELGLLASTGIGQVEVFSRLQVALLSTGDELVAPGTALAPGQIYNSNDAVLRGLLQSMGCDIVVCEHVADTPQATRRALMQAAGQADLVLTTGGVSVGEADYVKAAVEELGRLDLWKIAVKPGKPLAFGRVSDTVLVGLPGNPVSAFVTFCLFAAPVIRKMQGRHDPFPAALEAPAGFSQPAAKREEYVRVRLEQGHLQRYPHQGSGVLSSVVWADGLARIPADTAVAVGDPVGYFGFEALLA